MPDLLISGNNGNGSIDGLLGMQILDMMGKKVSGVNNTNDTNNQSSTTVDVASEEVKNKKK